MVHMRSSDVPEHIPRLGDHVAHSGAKGCGVLWVNVLVVLSEVADSGVADLPKERDIWVDQQRISDTGVKAQV